MRTEIKKTFTGGFKLTEQELVRINDVMLQQMKSETNDIVTFAELMFKNGIRSEKASLDEILAEHNSNQWEIWLLKIGAYNKSRSQKTRIEIEFRVPPQPINKDSPRPHSIYYFVLGDKRNWVYLTSSLLDDRVEKVKVSNMYYLFGLAAIIVGFTFGLVMLLLPAGSRPPNVPLGYRIISIIVSALLIIGGIIALYGFPYYSFYWGDYMEKYSNRRTLSLYVINGVIVALVISIIGGIIGTLFFLR